jgi:DNA-binding LytR/AlgR family response regulator
LKIIYGEDFMRLGICDKNWENNVILMELLMENDLPVDGNDYKLYTPGELLEDLSGEQFDCQVMFINTTFGDDPYNGMAMAEVINRRYPGCKIVYLSDDMAEVFDAYETCHSYFILRNRMNELLPKAVSVVMRAAMKGVGEETIKIKCHGRKMYLKQSDIIYAERDDRKIDIIANNRRYDCYMSLSELGRVPSEELIRSHGSYIVNLRHIAFFDKGKIQMDNGDYLPIGRAYEKNLRKAYNVFWLNQEAGTSGGLAEPQVLK